MLASDATGEAFILLLHHICLLLFPQLPLGVLLVAVTLPFPFSPTDAVAWGLVALCNDYSGCQVASICRFHCSRQFWKPASHEAHFLPEYSTYLYSRHSAKLPDVSLHPAATRLGTPLLLPYRHNPTSSVLLLFICISFPSPFSISTHTSGYQEIPLQVTIHMGICEASFVSDQKFSHMNIHRKLIERAPHYYRKFDRGITQVFMESVCSI